MEQAQEQGIFRFGEFEVDTTKRELRRSGEIVEIQPRVFDLLVFLLQNRDRAVDKDQLQDAVWPGMVITETALTRAVMKARKAVDDDASRQHVIRTLHGHGYRFVADVAWSEERERAEPPTDQDKQLLPEPAQSSSSETDADSQAGPDRDRSAASWKSRSGWLLATVALAAVLAWHGLRTPEIQGAEVRMAVLPVHDQTGKPDLAWARYGLMSYAASLLESEGSFPLISEGSVVSLASNLDWDDSLDSASGQKLLDRLASAYGSSHVLHLQLQNEGQALRMNYFLLAPGGQVYRGTQVGDEATQLTGQVVGELYRQAFRKRAVDDNRLLVSADPFNNEAFARGMDLSLQGRCAEATPFFEVIIEQEPTLFAPRFEYAVCLRILGEWQDAEATLDELIEERRAESPNRQLAQALMTLGILYNRTGRLDQAETVYAEAFEVSEAIGDRELSGKIMQNQSIIADDRGQWQKAEELLDLAQLAYQDAGLETMPGHLFSGRANLLMAQGEFAEAEGYLEQALAAFRAIGDRRNEAMMLNNTGFLKRHQGELDEAEDYHLRSLAIREEIGDRVGVARIHAMLSVVYTARGQYDLAIKSASAAAEVAYETRDRLFEGTALAMLADAEVAVGDLDSARLHFQQAKGIFVEIEDNMRALQADLKLARLDIREERLDRAEELALDVLGQSRERGHMAPEIQALELLGDVAMAREEPARAAEEFELALARVRESTWTVKENTLLYKLINAYLDDGRLEPAEPLAGALSQQPENVQSLKAQARVAHMRGESAHAVELMTKAKELAGEHWADSSEEALQEYMAGSPGV